MCTIEPCRKNEDGCMQSREDRCNTRDVVVASVQSGDKLGNRRG